MNAVSYTHLDVYKRQVYDLYIYNNVQQQIAEENSECPLLGRK